MKTLVYGNRRLTALMRWSLLVLGMSVLARAGWAQPYSLLHSFQQSDGANPTVAPLIAGECAYGTTWGGGAFDLGVLYRLNTNGTGFTVLKHFSDAEGVHPDCALTLLGDTLYGTASYGGISNAGVVFRINTNGSDYTLLKQFTLADGCGPAGRLALDPVRGLLYGTTVEGGSSDLGTIFRMSTNGADFQVLRHFTGPDGAWPYYADLVLSGTTLFGTTCVGGVSNAGTLFRLECDGSGFRLLKEFTEAEGGACSGGVVLAGNLLYGTTSYNGGNTPGTVFSITTEGDNFTVLHRFTDTGGPYGGDLLLLGSNLYGSSQNDGTFGFGTVFTVQTNGAGFAVLKHLRGADSDGDAPCGLSYADGVFYGATWYGAGWGTVFQLKTELGAPSILLPPQGQEVSLSSAVWLAVDALGSPPLSYQWLFNGTNLLSGATDASYAIAAAALADAGTYQVVVANAQGVVTSAVAVVTVLDPYFLWQPSDWSIPVGMNGGLTVQADGTPPLGYQWFKAGAPLQDGGNLSGAHTTMLLMTNVTKSDEGFYTVVVTNPVGALTSRVASLHVWDPFVFVDPTNRTVTCGGSTLLTVVAQGTGPLSYQWRKDGQPVAGATDSAWTLTNARASQAGLYDVVVTNANGAYTSQLASVQVNLAVAADFQSTNGYLQVLAVQPDGKILVTSSGFTAPSDGVARLNPDGSRDTAFNPGVYGAQAAAVLADGQILLGGLFTTVGGQSRPYLARLRADGTLDVSFQPPVVGFILGLLVQPDGRILAFGGATNPVTYLSTNIWRLQSDGSLDPTFRFSAPLVGGVFNCQALQPDGKVVVAGEFSNLASGTTQYVARINGDGSLDPSFNSPPRGANSGAYCLALQSDGKLLLGGWPVYSDYAYYRTGLVRLNPDGSVDPSFDVGYLNQGTWAVLPLPNGKIVLGGGFTSIQGVLRSYIALLNPDGTPDLSFDPGADNVVGYLHLLTNHCLLVGGPFSHLAGVPRQCLGELLLYEPPSPRLSPAAQTAEAGTAAGLVVCDQGFPSPSYAWVHNSQPLTGASTPALRLNAVQPTDAGIYGVLASNLVDVVTSPPAVLSVIAPVPRTTVAGLVLHGQTGQTLTLERANALSLPWVAFDTATLSAPAQWYFDLSSGGSSQGFYRAAAAQPPAPVLGLEMIPALQLSGPLGVAVRVDAIDRLGPTYAWTSLATVMQTNAAQWYFDTTAPGQPPRLYRLVWMP